MTWILARLRQFRDVDAMMNIAAVARAINFALRAAGRLLDPWLALAIRASLAQAFVVVQIKGLMLGTGLAEPLGATWWHDAAHRIAASAPGTAIQTLCPLLLLAGLLTRPAAAAMLLQVVLLPPTGMALDTGTVSVALLGWIVMSGPGTFSLDRLFGRGALSSALPQSRRAAALLAWSKVYVVPGALLLLRLGVAASVAGLGPTFAPTAMAGMLVGPMLVAVPILLLLGLGTRIVAVLLAAPVSLASALVADQRLLWVLLLAVLAVHGGGAPSLDRWLSVTLTRRRRAAMATGPRIVVVGGGFGGVALAKALAGTPCRVTLVDRSNYHLFQPLLYQVATAGLSPAEIATPIRLLFRDQENVRVLLSEVTGVDLAAKTVALGDRSLPYDTLVLATGARHAYFGHEEWSAIAPGLKTIEDATEIRGRLLLAFERAEGTDDPAERAAWLTFVVVGGGPTGVELAGAICELARSGLEGEFRSIDPAKARVLLVQSADRLLPNFPPDLSEAATASLRALGVEVMLKSKVDDVTPEAAVIGGTRLPARTILWAAGVMASPAASWVGAEADRAGRLPVGGDLSIAGHADVFAIGDTAASLAWGGKPLPGLAPAAKQGGQYVARVIRARLAGRVAPAPFRYHHLGSLATIGREAAVADFGKVRLHGALAWWIWGAAHITFLTTGRNRIAVVVDWVWAYLTFKRSTRLITTPARTQPQAAGGSTL